MNDKMESLLEQLWSTGHWTMITIKYHLTEGKDGDLAVPLVHERGASYVRSAWCLPCL